MREIKFRIWSPNIKKFMDSNECSIHASTGKLVTNRIVYWNPGGWPVIIEQYTGLKDKNGREIYEGDILHLPNNGPIGGRNGHVSWHDEGAIGWIVWSIWSDKHEHCSMLNTNDLQEVIGNIHENPELLGATESHADNR